MLTLRLTRNFVLSSLMLCSSLLTANEDPCCREWAEDPCCKTGEFLPDEYPPLFRPMLADPRIIDFSVGWRFNDNALTKASIYTESTESRHNRKHYLSHNAIPVSFGDSIPIYRWFDAWPIGGQLQIDLEGCVWAVFDPTTESSPLINADYYVGFPITYAFDNWSFRLRGFHISSHIGDEFLLNKPNFDRRNASAEYVDFFVANDLTDEIRVYGGLGYIVAQDDEFHCSPFYAAAGYEIKLQRLGFTSCQRGVYGVPFHALYWRYSPDYKRHADITYMVGYEIGKTCGTQKRMRWYMEYHDGYSVEGQLCKVPTNYFALGMSYGY